MEERAVGIVVDPRDQGRRLLVGVVGAPHGVRGEVRIQSHMQVPAAIGGRRVFTAATGTATLRVASARALKDAMVVARLDGIETREAAAALTGTRLYIDRASLGPVEEDEFYHADLIGLPVCTTEGAPVGTVVAVVDYGGGDLLEIETAPGMTVLVPFLKRFVPTVDLAGGRVEIVPEAVAAEDDPEPGAP